MFAISERARQVFDDLNHFVDQRLRPAEIVFREQMKDAPEPFWRPVMGGNCIRRVEHSCHSSALSCL